MEKLLLCKKMIIESNEKANSLTENIKRQIFTGTENTLVNFSEFPFAIPQFLGEKFPILTNYLVTKYSTIVIEKFRVNVTYMENEPTYSLLFKIKDVRKELSLKYTSIGNLKVDLYKSVLNTLLFTKHEFTQLPLDVQEELLSFCELPTDNPTKYSLAISHIDITLSRITSKITINVDGHILLKSEKNTTHIQVFNFLLCDKNTEIPYMELFLMLDYLEENNISNETTNSRGLTKPFPSKLAYYIQKENLPMTLLTYQQDIALGKETINFRINNSNIIGTLDMFNKNVRSFSYNFVLTTEWKKKIDLTNCTYTSSTVERIEKSVVNLLAEIYDIIQLLP